MNILKLLPASLVDAAILNQPEGCEHVAWRRAEALGVIHHLDSTDFAVLGGDVLVLRGQEFNHALDGWYCEHQKSESWASYAARSRREAREYLTRYPEQGEMAYVLEFQDKPSARDLLLEGGVDPGA